MNRPEQPPPPSNRLTRFSDRVRAYAAYRPSYPAEAIDAVLEGMVPSSSLAVADVGAGTGISSRLFAARGCRVYAIEPNREMRERGSGSSDPLISWHDATGEQTGLVSRSADLVACFQAFHWLDSANALAEFQRILRAGGRAALVWNVRDDTDPFTRAYSEVILRHATDPPRSPHLGGGGHVPAEFRERWRDYRVRRAMNSQPMNREELIGRALSASYCPNEGQSREALVQDLCSIFEQSEREGSVSLRYVCEAHLAEKT